MVPVDQDSEKTGYGKSDNLQRVVRMSGWHTSPLAQSMVWTHFEIRWQTTLGVWDNTQATPDALQIKPVDLISSSGQSIWPWMSVRYQDVSFTGTYLKS